MTEKRLPDALKVRCGKYLSGYGLHSMFQRLEEYSPTKLIIDVDVPYIYVGVREMYAEDELKYTKMKIAQLEDQFVLIKNAINA